MLNKLPNYACCVRSLFSVKGILSGWIVFLLSVELTHGQLPNAFTGGRLQRIEIADTFLVRQLRRIIQYQQQTDTLFAKGLGYLVLNLVYMDEPAPVVAGDPSTRMLDTVMAYYCSVSFMAPDKADNHRYDVRPFYYAYVDKRLVIFSMGVPMLEHTPASVRRLRRIMQPFVEKPGWKMQVQDGVMARVLDIRSRDRFKFWEEFRIYYTRYPLSDRYEPPIVVRSELGNVSPF